LSGGRASQADGRSDGKWQQMAECAVHWLEEAVCCCEGWVHNWSTAQRWNAQSGAQWSEVESSAQPLGSGVDGERRGEAGEAVFVLCVVRCTDSCISP